MLANLPSYVGQNWVERAQQNKKFKCSTSSFPMRRVSSTSTLVSETNTFTRYWLMIPFGCRGFFQVILISVASTSATCKSNTAPGTKKEKKRREL